MYVCITNVRCSALLVMNEIILTKNIVNMKRYIFSVSLFVGCLLFTSCVSKKQFVGLQDDYKTLQIENGKLNQSYQDAQVQLLNAVLAVKALMTVWQKPERVIRNYVRHILPCKDLWIKAYSRIPRGISISQNWWMRLMHPIALSNNWLKQNQNPIH